MAFPESRDRAVKMQAHRRVPERDETLLTREVGEEKAYPELIDYNRLPKAGTSRPGNNWNHHTRAADCI